MDLSHVAVLLIGLILGLLLGAVLTWAMARGRYAAPLAAAGAERDALAQRVTELRHHVYEQIQLAKKGHRPAAASAGETPVKGQRAG